MVEYPLLFLVAGVIAGALNLAGLTAVAGQMSWILVGIVLVVIRAVTGHTTGGG